MEKSERSVYTPLDFAHWAAANMLEISPKFQRRSVWNRAARSYLIDTILLSFPVPPIYLRVSQSKDKSHMIREVIDGQQRISAVLDFMNDEYTLTKDIQSKHRGKTFSSLPEADKNKIRQYPFICEVFYGIDDREVLQIFARLNVHSVKLNSQELRNGRFFGEFKNSAYNLSYEHLEFWRNNRIFTELAIARMNEVELVSELLILQIDGVQDKKKTINTFYEQFDDTYKERETHEKRFENIIDELNKSLDGIIEKTNFRRSPLFYSLYGAVYHKMYGIPNFDLTRDNKGALTKEDAAKLRDTVIYLSDLIDQSKNDEDIPAKLRPFVTACLRQTDNVRPRSTRIATVYQHAFL